MRELDDGVRRATGARPLRYRAVSGGYSTADRFVVDLDDGRSVFVKSSTAPNLAEWLRREHEVYAALEGTFMPLLVGFDDDGVRPLLALEDLSGADWSTRWDSERVAAVLEALAELSTCAPPPNTPAALEIDPTIPARWRAVADDPAPFLSLGLRDERWLERALPEILAAAARARVDGDDLVHLDVRSDNICFRDGAAVLVDWNWCARGNSAVDIAAWAPSVAVEGGPKPWEILPGHGDLAALVAGIWASTAGLPPPATAPTVRAVQRAQLAAALDWVDRDLL